MKPFLFLLTAGIVLSGCSSPAPAPPPKRSVSAYVRYLTAEGQVHAEFTVYERGSTDSAAVPIALPAPPVFVDEEMKLYNPKKPAYAFEEPSGFKPDLFFNWRLPEGKTQRLSFNMPRLLQFSFDPSPLNRRKPAKFSWEGGTIEKGESIVFIWENKQTRETVPMEIVPAAGSGSIDFPASQIAKLQPGTWNLYLVRKKLHKILVDDTPCEVITEFFTPTVSLQVIP